jgi:uncharacterized protein YheU (UPF0270 family)
MVIPHKRLSPEALLGVIEEFVTREGTDHGGVSVPLHVKVTQVRNQLESGRAVLVYDEETQSCNIIPTERS